MLSHLTRVLLLELLFLRVMLNGTIRNHKHVQHVIGNDFFPCLFLLKCNLHPFPDTAVVLSLKPVGFYSSDFNQQISMC